MATMKRKSKETASKSKATAKTETVTATAKTKAKTVKSAAKTKVKVAKSTVATTATAAKAKSLKPIKDHQTRVEILQTISDKTNLKRVDVEAVFTEMANLVKGHLSKKGSGEVMIPKLGLKIRKVRRKATKKRTMVSPLTGNEVTIPAKPARDDVKLIALKTLKEAVS